MREREARGRRNADGDGDVDHDHVRCGGGKRLMPSVVPMGPFDLANQIRYFGGWPSLAAGSVVMAFPVEGWASSAAVVVAQAEDGRVETTVHGGDVDAASASAQALAALSLDVDGAGWPAVGDRDARIGDLQRMYGWVRPTLFHSPYEAAAHFIIGHRISMQQGRAIRQRMAEALGDAVSVDGQAFHAFPRPQQLLEMTAFPGLNATKVARLHGVATAALAGKLDRGHLRALPSDEARRQLQGLDGVGPFFASGIQNRGAGVVDEITDDELTRYAVRCAYQLGAEPTSEEVATIASGWQPYRMWAEVLLHIWVRREVGLPRRERRTHVRDV